MIDFLASQNGRIARIVAGLVLIVAGFLIGDTAGIVIAVIGVVPLAAGALDICLFAPLFGQPLQGPQIRSRKQH